MKQYEFTGLEKTTRGQPFLPPEAMYIDNIPLEDRIDGYQTLTVEGRELIHYDNETTKVSGHDGSMWLGATYGTREIKVKYMLKAKNDQDFREKFELLNYCLSQKQFKFHFFDDPLYEWTGTVTSNSEFPAGTNRGVSEFIITCTNPFKRRIEPVIYSGNHTVRISEPAYWNTMPDEINITLASNATQVNVINGDKIIILVGTFHSGDKIKLEPSEDVEIPSKIYLNEQENLNLLALSSDFENFTVKYEDVITVNPQDAKVEIKLRSKHL